MPIWAQLKAVMCGSCRNHVGQIKRPGSDNKLSQNCLGMGQVHSEVPSRLCGGLVCHQRCCSKCCCPVMYAIRDKIVYPILTYDNKS
eukprot:6202303-Pleurochrysis_carterae.AAC.1